MPAVPGGSCWQASLQRSPSMRLGGYSAGGAPLYYDEDGNLVDFDDFVQSMCDKIRATLAQLEGSSSATEGVIPSALQRPKDAREQSGAPVQQQLALDAPRAVPYNHFGVCRGGGCPPTWGSGPDQEHSP